MNMWRAKVEVPEPDEFMIHSSGSEEDSSLQSATSEEESEEEEEEAKPPPKAKKAPKAKTAPKTTPARSETAALTGSLAPFSTLSCRRSHDPVLSSAWELHGRLVTYKWKQLLWMMRAREAMWEEGRRWRWNPR